MLRLFFGIKKFRKKEKYIFRFFSEFEGSPEKIQGRENVAHQNKKTRSERGFEDETKFWNDANGVLHESESMHVRVRVRVRVRVGVARARACVCVCVCVCVNRSRP